MPSVTLMLESALWWGLIWGGAYWLYGRLERPNESQKPLFTDIIDLNIPPPPAFDLLFVLPYGLVVCMAAWGAFRGSMLAHDQRKFHGAFLGAIAWGAAGVLGFVLVLLLEPPVRRSHVLQEGREWFSVFVGWLGGTLAGLLAGIVVPIVFDLPARETEM
jgi:hypothetical protein